MVVCEEGEVGPGIAGKAMAFRVHSFHVQCTLNIKILRSLYFITLVKDCIELSVTEGKKII